MSHPCDGHACDHCHLCDVVGICCATVPGGAPAVAGCCPDTTAQLRQAIVDETESLVGLSQLLRAEITLHIDPTPEPAALPPGPASEWSSDLKTEKEAEHVAAP